MLKMFGLLGVCFGFYLLGYGVCWVGLKPVDAPHVTMQLEAPDIEPQRVPYPICFGKTIYGDGVIVNNSYFDESPLLIVGDYVHVNSSSFNGGRYGIYVTSPTTMWVQGSIIMNAHKVGIALGAGGAMDRTLIINSAEKGR